MKHTVIACCLIASATLAAAQVPTDSPAAAAARKRQEAIRSADFRFVIREVTEPGGIPAAPAMFGGDGKAYPTRQVRMESRNRLLLDGDRMRFEDNHPIPSTVTHQWDSEHGIQVSDGKNIKRYRVSGSDVATRSSAHGQIGTLRSSHVGDEFRHHPIFFACRGISNPSCKMFKVISDFSPTGQRLSVGKDVWDEYSSPVGNLTFRLWADSNQDCLVRRLTIEQPSGRVSCQIDVRNGVDSASGLPYPKQWTLTRYTEAGGVARTFELEVTEVTFNREWPASEFDIQFPPGIEVWDRRDDNYYLVRDDGTMHRLKGAGQPIDAETKSSLESNWFSRNAIWISTALATIVVVLVAIWRTTRRRSTTGKQ